MNIKFYLFLLMIEWKAWLCLLNSLHTHTLNPAKKYIQSNQIKQIEEEEEIIKTFSLV